MSNWLGSNWSWYLLAKWIKKYGRLYFERLRFFSLIGTKENIFIHSVYFVMKSFNHKCMHDTTMIEQLQIEQMTSLHS